MSISITIRKYGYLTLIIFLGVVGSLMIYWFGNSLFEIKSIEVVGTDVKVEVDKNRITRNLLFFSGDKLSQQILYDNSLVSNITFRKQFPHTLIIVVEVRKPIAVIRTASTVMGIDKTGVLIAPSRDDYPLPELKFGLSEAFIGQKISDQQILESLTFINLVHNFIQLSSVEATYGASLLARAPKIDIIIAQNRRLSDTAATLQTLLVGFRIKGNLPTNIDLRFDKPIVKF